MPGILGGLPPLSLSGGDAAPSFASGRFDQAITFDSPFIVGEGNAIAPGAASGPAEIIRAAAPWIAATIGLALVAKKFL